MAHILEGEAIGIDSSSLRTCREGQRYILAIIEGPCADLGFYYESPDMDVAWVSCRDAVTFERPDWADPLPRPGDDIATAVEDWFAECKRIDDRPVLVVQSDATVLLSFERDRDHLWDAVVEDELGLDPSENVRDLPGGRSEFRKH